MSLIDLSGNLLYVAFICYLVGTLLFGGAIKEKMTRQLIAQTSMVRLRLL